MGKYQRKIKPDEGRLYPPAEEEEKPVPVKADEERKGKAIAAIVFLTAACLLVLVSAVFFGLNVSRMRDYELHYERMQGTVTDVETVGFGTGARLALVISYSYGGENFVLHDGQAFRGTMDIIGAAVELYVHPQNPALAATVSSADVLSEVSVVLFALGAVLFPIAAFISGRTKFLQRTLCVYLPVIFAGAIFTALCLLCLPDGGNLFLRVRGAVGYVVVLGIMLVAAVLDGTVSRLKKKR